MKIELKKFQFFERMSEETNAFVADVYINGKKAAYAKNDGHGGCTFYDHYDGMRGLVEQAEAYCKSLPPKKYDNLVIDMDLEAVIDDLVMDELEKKEQKKMEKKMEKAILFGVPKGHSYSMVSFKVPLSQIPKDKLQATVDKYKAQLKKGEVFFNTNFEKLGIKI